MNTARMRSIMVLHGDTNAALASVIGISPQTFSVKINERNGSEFTQSEISKIRERYNLSPEEIDDIFFKEKVS